MVVLIGLIVSMLCAGLIIGICKLFTFMADRIDNVYFGGFIGFTILFFILFLSFYLLVCLLEVIW